MNISFLKLFGAIIFALIACACTDEQEDWRPDPDYSLNASQDGVRPMQLVSIEVSGISNLEDHYKGTFGTIEIDLIKEGGNQLLFVVPATAVGEKQTLKVSLNNREKQVDFTVLQKVDVPDGNAYLQAILTEARESMGTESEDARIKEVTEALGGWIGSYEEALSSLVQEEKDQLALLLKTNLMVEEQHVSSRLMSYDCFDRYAPIYMKNLALMLVGGKMVGSGQLLNVAMPGLGLVVGIAGGVTFLQGAKRVLETVRDIHDCPIFRHLESYNFNQRLLEDKLLEFESNQQQELVLHVNYRSLDREDTSHPVAFVKSIAESIIDFESILKSLKQQLNSVRAFFGVNSKNIPISADPVLQKNGTIQVLPLQSGSVTVENISNEKVILGENTLAEGKLSLAFKSESLSAQEFDFDLVITDGPIEHREKIAARILPEEVVIEGVGLEELNAEPGSDLAIKIKILTASGSPVRNADVEFALKNGKGTFKQLKVITDEEGIASTEFHVDQENTVDIVFETVLFDENNGLVLSEEYTIKAKGDLFLGKWFLISQSTNERSSVYSYVDTEYFINSHMTFLADNTFEFDVTGTYEEGNWNDTGFGQYIRMTDDIYFKVLSGDNAGDENTFKITKLTENEMIWYVKKTANLDHEGEQISVIKEDEWYFKRKK
ncbi:lipocalin-like domain-containing protein [Pleomorphovibrio marinus]|uniref:lipocalin family protein n=1 Tax=Pleomorphovibrio marinus TaxID=2164132 RepID=UPI000E0C6A36|nr:lipocalin family protein [Pleomorphovibrio marinus]